MAEFDVLERSVFLERYGFEEARDYLLVADGREYDSKAIVGVAYKFVPGFGRPLDASELDGGKGDAVRKLISLGFSVTKKVEDPDWTWDEHVLALELYLSNPTSPPGKRSPEVTRLSALLNSLGERRGIARTEKFRNANGVYMKLMNFRRLDPQFQAIGKAGLSRGAKGEQAVWEAYRADFPSLAIAAAAIRLAIDDQSVALSPDPDDYEASEGAIVLRLHRSRERDRNLVEKKKAHALAAQGRLVCEVCAFDFSDAYGTPGQGFIEAHHRKPISTLRLGEKTRLADLALVCANCHRILHRKMGSLSVEALKVQVEARRMSDARR
ncbi:MAG: HNH endonuclease [Pseudomonadota bacterium]